MLQKELVMLTKKNSQFLGKVSKIVAVRVS
jgi:hypothetical protein